MRFTFTLSPVYISNNIEATFDFVETTFDFVTKSQQCRNEFIVKYHPFDKVECCFDIVAVLATMSTSFL